MRVGHGPKHFPFGGPCALVTAAGGPAASLRAVADDCWETQQLANFHGVVGSTGSLAHGRSHLHDTTVPRRRSLLGRLEACQRHSPKRIPTIGLQAPEISGANSWQQLAFPCRSRHLPAGIPTVFGETALSNRQAATADAGGDGLPSGAQKSLGK